MPKPAKAKKPGPETAAKKLSNKEAVYLFLPWACKHYPDRSEIEAYLPGRDWETIAEIPANPGVDAELIAGFIMRVVNSHEKSHDLISQMVAALELCLSCEGKITWEAEQEARVLVARARQGQP